MKNKIFESPQKSQVNILYRKLKLDQDSQSLIEELIEQQSFYDLKEQKFKDLPENQKIICAIFILYFQSQLKELQNVSLSLLVDKIFSFKKKVQDIKLTFRIIRDLKKQQKIEIPNFEQIHNTIGYFGIIFTIFKKVKQNFGNIFQDENFKKIWIVLVYLAKKQDLTKSITLQEILDLMSALLLYQLQKNTNEIQFQQRRQQLANYSYELSDEEFENFKVQIDAQIPDFHDPFFDCQEYEKKDIDYLIFLEEDNEGSNDSNQRHVMLTPIVRNSNCISKSGKDLNNNIFKNSPLQNISLDLSFNEIQNQINTKKQKLLSPTLKKQFDESDRTLDLPKMFQWYKNIIKNVEITKVVIENVTYQVNVSCQDMLNDPKIRENYRKILLIVENFQST